MPFHRAAFSISAALLLLGCGAADPSVRYSGATLAANHPRDVKVYRGTNPDRPFEELGTISVACPTNGRERPFGQVTIEGGCNFGDALSMAIEKAAQAGADAIFHIQTTVAGNGDIVSMTAVAARFTGPEPTPAPTAATTPEAAATTTATQPPAQKATPEERLARLKQLADQGLITADEYAKRKAEILEHDL